MSIYVTKPFLPPIDEYNKYTQDIFSRNILTNQGPCVVDFETKMKDFLSVKNFQYVTNGTIALQLALKALDINDGEIITTPFSYVATTSSILWERCKPIFVDIEPHNFTIDVNKIEAAITPQTKAIMPVHVFGYACNVEEIQKIAEKHNLKVIYDAAHAFGETYKGKGIGNFGDASIFSFHATKVFNTIEGGAVSYSNEDYGIDLYRLKNFGIRGPETVDFVGANAKMNEFQAAMGLCNIRYVDGEIEKRKFVFHCYMERLKDLPGLSLPLQQKEVKNNYAYFPIVVWEKEFGKTRDIVFEALAKENIYSRKYFYPLTNTYDCFEGQFDVKSTPTAVHISQRVLTLPMYADLTENQVDKICEIIRKEARC